MSEFKPFSKIGRLSKDIIITEKIDGTNAQVFIQRADKTPPEVLEDPKQPFIIVIDDYVDYVMFAGSRNRWLSLEDDNYGFARFVRENCHQLILLGEGRHFGEWWGSGINRGYGQPPGEKHFSLFNVGRWTAESVPPCVSVVPTLYQGPWHMQGGEWAPNYWMRALRSGGSRAAPFRDPEGIIIYQQATGLIAKMTEDDQHKGLGGV